MTAGPIIPCVDYRLCFVVGPSSTGKASWRDVLMRALDGGVTCVQLREKFCSVNHLVDLAEEGILACRQYATPFLINDSVDAAALCAATGVHLGQRDTPWRHARQHLGTGAIIGLTVESMDEARQAEPGSLNYLGVSSIFSTQTKEDIRHIWGLSGLAAVRKVSSLPLMAIGGINEDNVTDVIRAGADGVAVVSCLASATNPTRVAKRLIESIDAALAERTN